MEAERPFNAGSVWDHRWGCRGDARRSDRWNGSFHVPSLRPNDHIHRRRPGQPSESAAGRATRCRMDASCRATSSHAARRSLAVGSRREHWIPFHQELASRSGLHGGGGTGAVRRARLTPGKTPPFSRGVLSPGSCSAPCKRVWSTSAPISAASTAATTRGSIGRPLTDWVGDDHGNWLGGESIAPDSRDANTVYAAAGMYSSNPAAILRSNDQGRTWLATPGADSNGRQRGRPRAAASG